jgi:hypothetical protein
MKGHKEHHHRKAGGKVEPEITPKPYNAQRSEVEKEAEEKKHGGKVKRAHGGKTEHHVDGMKGKHRLDRPGRKRGGRAGADMSPLTTASKVTNAQGHSATEGNAEEGP